MTNALAGVLSNVSILSRFVTEEKVLEIEVEPGVADGHEIPFIAEGLSFAGSREHPTRESFIFFQANLMSKANQAI